MDFARYYQPPSSAIWQGRPDAPPRSSFFQLVQCLDLSDAFPAVSDNLVFVLLGFACDEGVRRNLGRTGAAEGPKVLRSVLAKHPVHRAGVTLLDAGNITCPDQDLEGAQQALAQAVQRILEKGAVPIVMGGGHELAWGHFQGIVRQGIARNLGIVNFDAHFDMRPLLPGQKGTSGTPFLQIAMAAAEAKMRFDYNCIGIQSSGNTTSLFKTAKQYHCHVLSAGEMAASSAAAEAFVARVIQDNVGLYLSLCLDVFATAHAPGVSAPEPFGLTPWQVIPRMRQIASSGKVVSYDIAELSPVHDIDLATARLAASFIDEIIHFHQPAT